MPLAFSRKSRLPLAIATIFVAGIVAGGWRYFDARRTLLTELGVTAGRYAVAFDPREIAALSSAPTPPDELRAGCQARLERMRQVGVTTRSVYLFRHHVASGRTDLLASAQAPGSAPPLAWHSGYGTPAQTAELRAASADRQTSAVGPHSDDAGQWATAFAPIGPALPDGFVDLLGLEVSASAWSKTLWSEAMSTAAYVWMFLILPLATLVSTRRQNRQRDTLRNLTEAMEQGQSAVMIVALDQRIEYANTGFCRQLGYSRPDLIGRVWRDFQGFQAPPELVHDLVKTIGAGQSWSGEWMMRRKDGDLFPVRGGVTPVKDRSGVIRSFVVVFDDVTEIRETERLLREAKDRAEAGDRAKGQFLATMSHEVRTPLNGIVGFASLLLDTDLTPEQQEFVGTIRTSSETLIQLTGDILDYARIESGRFKLESQPCDPRECIENALDLVAGTAAEKNIELLHWIDDSVPPAILVDVGRLRQVLVNLVNNAVKFTAKGEVEVVVRASALHPARGDRPSSAVLEFSVRDTGIGIAAEHHDKIFRPFTQVDESTTRRFGGTGLGLAICKNIIELMDGTISFGSEPGAGSTFMFTIRVQLHVAEGLPDARPTLTGQRLAIVAQGAGLAQELSRLGRRLGADVFTDDLESLRTRTDWNVAVVDVSETVAVDLAASTAPYAGLPPEKIIGLVSIGVPTELRTALRTHFRVLLNKPPHHDSLCSLLSARASTSPFVPPSSDVVMTHYGLNVLIVEDNAVNQQLIQRVVSNLGCRWTAAPNGRVALEQIARATPDVILMDLHMPELDGLSTTKKLRAGELGEAARGVWIIALTADVRVEQRERTLNAGANDYLTKPLRQQELMSALDRYRLSVAK